MSAIASVTGGKAYTAQSAASVVQIYRTLGSSIGRRPGHTEVTDDFLAGALVLLVLGGGLSAIWAPRLP